MGKESHPHRLATLCVLCSVDAGTRGGHARVNNTVQMGGQHASSTRECDGHRGGLGVWEDCLREEVDLMALSSLSDAHSTSYPLRDPPVLSRHRRKQAREIKQRGKETHHASTEVGGNGRQQRWKGAGAIDLSQHIRAPAHHTVLRSLPRARIPPTTRELGNSLAPCTECKKEFHDHTSACTQTLQLAHKGGSITALHWGLGGQARFSHKTARADSPHTPIHPPTHHPPPLRAGWVRRVHHSSVARTQKKSLAVKSPRSDTVQGTAQHPERDSHR
jgi:hypothetical protein